MDARGHWPEPKLRPLVTNKVPLLLYRVGAETVEPGTTKTNSGSISISISDRPESGRVLFVLPHNTDAHSFTLSSISIEWIH